VSEHSVNGVVWVDADGEPNQLAIYGVELDLFVENP
jgi:hypothetical protein